MPYLHLDLPGTYPIEVKRELAARLCKLYAEVMETQLWRPNVGIAELGEHNLYHLGPDGLEPITMVMVEFRRGRSAEKRLALGRAIVDTCVDLLGVPRRTVMVEFTPHVGEEILRDGNWTADWTPAEAVTGCGAHDCTVMVVLNAELRRDFREGGTKIFLRHTGQPLDTREYVPK